MIGDPTEGALVVLAEKGGLDAPTTRERYPRVAELPFDAEYKLMATFHRMEDGSGRDVVRCYVKGAPDQLLDRAASILDANLEPTAVNDDVRTRYSTENERLGKQGLRVLATGRKDFDPASFDPSTDLLPQIEGLTLLALVGIVDPPRPTAKDAIATAKAAGIQVRMITGDHAVTAEAIGRQLGIEGRAITGTEWAAMSDEEAAREIDGIGVIARVTPEDKVRLVNTLKGKGHVVAMTGDGVNDAPALKRADIGIAMGITGSEVSKEAAAMILTDDNFATIVKAVELGRALYENLAKYIRFQMGVLVGLILTFVGASIFNVLGGVVFLPLQTLWVNFTTQVFQAVGLGYGRASDHLMQRKPRSQDEPILDRALFAGIATAGFIMAAATLAITWWASDTYTDQVARTMALASFGVANLVFSFTCLNERRSVFSLETIEDRKFLTASAMSFAAIVVGTEVGVVQRILDTVDLTFKQWLIAIGFGLTVLVASEIRKAILRRRAGDTPTRAGGAPAALVDPAAG